MGSGGMVPPFLTSALDRGEWLASCPGHFTSREIAPGAHFIGGYILYIFKKFPSGWRIFWHKWWNNNKQLVHSLTLTTVTIPIDGPRDCAVDIAIGYGLDSQEVGIQVLVGARFSPLHIIQSGSKVHPASCPMGTRGPLLMDKVAEEWSWLLTSS
jgi:hypothetical protein